MYFHINTFSYLYIIYATLVPGYYITDIIREMMEDKVDLPIERLPRRTRKPAPTDTFAFIWSVWFVWMQERPKILIRAPNPKKTIPKHVKKRPANNNRGRPERSGYWPAQQSVKQIYLGKLTNNKMIKLITGINSNSRWGTFLPQPFKPANIFHHLSGSIILFPMWFHLNKRVRFLLYQHFS